MHDLSVMLGHGVTREGVALALALPQGPAGVSASSSNNGALPDSFTLERQPPQNQRAAITPPVETSLATPSVVVYDAASMLGPHRKVVAASAVVISVVLSGCFPDTSGVTPDVASYYVYYPIALGTTRPDGRYLLTVNSNFDLMFNSGSVVPFDLEPIEGIVGECRQSDDGACPELVVASEREAKDASTRVADFLLDEHAVLIGSYASALAVTDGLALVPVRADASLHFIDVAEVPREELDRRRVLRCGWGESADLPGKAQECGSHRRARSGRRLRDGETIGVPSEPYGIEVWLDRDAETEYAVVAHMVGGEVSLFERLDATTAVPAQECGDASDNDGDGLTDRDDPGCGGSSMSLIDVNDSFEEGTTGVAVDLDGRFLAASRFTSNVSAFRVNSGEIAPVKVITFDAVDPGTNQRGIALSPDGTLAYVISRSPESLIVLDISRDDNGEYLDRFRGAIEVGNGPSLVRVLEDPRLPAGYLLYVVCFSEDRVFVVDPVIDDVVDIISTRRGPHDLVFDSDLGVAYLANFLESTVSVLDVDPESPRYHTILTTLGTPRRPRTND